MTCANCGRAHGPGARFCGGCGKPLAPRCPQCGVESPPDARFCEGCGASLAAAPAAKPADDAVARKVVTIVFADLIGSTSLHERLDPESVSRVMDRYHRTVRAPVEAHGGTVVQLLGDGVMCAFGVPRVAEDDAIRAVRAAVGIQRAFREFAREERAVVGDTGLRVAVNTGEVVVSDDYAAGIGDPLNVAARLQQEGRDGDVLIGESTERLVRALVTLAPIGKLSLKGRAETVAAYRVVSLERPAGASATSFVGREDELRRVLAVYDAAVANRRARLAVILGSPGLGKSRLMDEVARRLGDGATVLTAQCDAAGGATFAPIAKALRAHLRIDDAAGGEALRAAIEAVLPGDDAERARIAGGIAALLGGTPASPEETFFVVRRLLARLASAQPVVLAIDDLHWAEPLLLDLTEHLVQWSTEAPLLVLAAARPELREARSSLTVPTGLVTDVVTLAGLDAGAATRLAANVIGATELPAAVAGRVLATSEGNPLFVGELVRMLVADGALKREGDRWTTGVELAQLEMPPTIQALLAARIERLRPEERTVLERAAVVGRQFSRAAVTHLLPREITDLDARLEALRRSELIEPDTGWFLGEPALRFHHVLVRDAAYRRLLKNTRAELHARFADWLEAWAGDAVEHDETIGWHLEQAHQHLRELGPVDAQGRVLGERAARHLAAAGRRALARDDLPLAAGLLGRALDRLDSTDPARADLALDWCEALLAAGDVGPAAPAIAELGRFVGESARLQAWHTCFAGQLAALTDPQTLRATADAVAAAAEVLAAAGDTAGEAKAHSVHAIALGRLGKVGAAEAALDRALAAARRAHDRRRSNAVLASAPLAALWGPSPVTRASGRCLDVVRVLRITQGAPAVEAVALRCQGVLEALRGRTDAARRMLASSRRMVEELGITQRLLEADVFAGLVELLEGDAGAAERSLRAAYEGLREHGLRIDAAQAAALLGRALLALDRAEEAEAVSHESEALAGDDLKAAIAWRGVRAEALARRGEHAAAVDFARAAVDIAAATDALLDHADARLALATALRAAGRMAEAAGEEARAIELWEAKGATLLAERARRGVEAVVHPDRVRDDRARPARPARRRVQANAATTLTARLDAAIATRDVDAIGRLLADEHEMVNHPTGSTHDRQGMLASWRTLLRAEHPTCRTEPLATLGDALVLCRQSMSASRFAGGTFDVGPYERQEVVLREVDSNGRLGWAEVFADERLGDGIARLYARYAGQLLDGPERDRAAATARSVAALLGPLDAHSHDEVWAADTEFVDHRRLGLGAARGADRVLRGYRTLFEVADDVAYRHEDVFGLRSDALLVQRTTSGTGRTGGGPFETKSFVLFVFGIDGLVTRTEWFDDDRADQALARFDELIGGPTAPSLVPPFPAPDRPERQVRPNRATAYAARNDAAIANHDADTLSALHSDRFEVIDHTTGAVYGRQGALAGWHALMRAEHPTHRHEPLATLGDSLALLRLSQSASGLASGRFDVGAFERDLFELGEVDAQGRCIRLEAFAVDHLGDAIARLYERYAERLPEGPERGRAAAMARAVAVAFAHPDPDRFGEVLAPAVEFVDHRTLGLGSVRGAERNLRGLRALLELTDDFAVRVDDVLGLQSGAILVHWTNSGTDRATGGAFERQFILLWVVGPDGLMARVEWFDSDREAEALARFDELTPTPSRAAGRRKPAVRPNAVTATAAWIDAVVAARDERALAQLAELTTDEYEVVDHINGTTYDRSGSLGTWQALMRVPDLASRHEALATLGDSFALFRHSVSAGGVRRGRFDVGAYENERILLVENDSTGRRRRSEAFHADRLGDAVARLYARHAELLPDGPERVRATAMAHSIATLVGPIDLDRYATAVAGDLVVVDHSFLVQATTRGSESLWRVVRAQLDLSDSAAIRIDDVLATRDDALLIHWTNFGTDRASGGAYERPRLVIWTFDADGLLGRWEQFDADRDDEALARFHELTGEVAALRSTLQLTEECERQVRANAATANNARLAAAITTRDGDALPALFAEDAEFVEHLTGAVYDWKGVLRSFRSLLAARDPTYRQEPVATLGDALALCRVSWGASGLVGGNFDVGAYEADGIHLVEVDAQGRRRRNERFAVERLGDAVARLYERYAELLPDGPERDRATATARSLAALLGPADPDHYATALAPDIELADRRTMGFGSGRGADAAMRVYCSLSALADDIVERVDDVFALRSDALLVRRTGSGTLRDGGGPYERQYMRLWVFGTDGLLARCELFDADRFADALARFDELTAEPPAVASRAAEKRNRRVPANAASEHAARVDAAIAARDADALPALIADEVEGLEHPTGVPYDRAGVLFSFRSLLRAGDPTFRHEPLAALGDALVLCRASWSASGLASAKFDIGAYEGQGIDLIEVDAQGRRRAAERFAADRLGDAVVRLYERYAELLPDGPARNRAAATARSVAAYVGPNDPDRYAAAFAPTLETVDRRILGTWSARGAEALLRAYRSWLDLADDTAFREDDILDLQPGALLVRRTFSGIDRAGGGVFEREFIQLWTFGNDGLIARLEYFDVGREAEALARLDELVGERCAPRVTPTPSRAAKRRVRPNAATANAARLDAAAAAREPDAMCSLIADPAETIDHITGVTYDREGALATIRSGLGARELTCRNEALATLGDALALCRESLSASGFAGARFDVGAYERDRLLLIEVGANGRRRRTEIFADDRLGDAVVRLYERYAELLPDGSARARAVATARSVAAQQGPWNPDRSATAYASAIEAVDHRILGTWSASGDEVVRQLRSLLEVADDVVFDDDEVLCLGPDALLTRRTHSGTDRAGGGPYERVFLMMRVFGADGLVTHMEYFDADREAEALARLDELTTAAPAARFENAATRWSDRLENAWEARDWERVAASFAPGLRVVDRRKMVRIELDRAGHLDTLRFVFGMRSSRLTVQLLATRGNRLALARTCFEASDRDAGPSEVAFLRVSEVDDHGAAIAIVAFDPDDLDAAYAELDDRYVAGEAAAFRHAKALGAITRAFAARDWDAVATLQAPDLVVHDHSPLGWGTLDRPTYVESVKALVALAPDSRIRTDHHWLSDRAALGVHVVLGTHEGGAYEQPRVTVSEFDAEGRERRRDIYTLDQLDEAQARFAALGARTGSDPLAALARPNAATAAMDRVQAAYEARDWAAMRDACTTDAKIEDRRRHVLLSGDVDAWIADRERAARAGVVYQRGFARIAGERLALERVSCTTASGEGLFESEHLWLTEVDAGGRITSAAAFDVDDWRAAEREGMARMIAGDPVAAASLGPVLEFIEAFNDRDPARQRAVLADDVVVEDHRRTGVGRVEGASSFVENTPILWGLAPDIQFDAVHMLACDRHGFVGAGRNFGTLADGGGAFEVLTINVFSVERGRITRFEVFEPEDVDAALARFAELRPDPLRIPPNAATRAVDRHQRALETQDWGALDALCAPTLEYDDRRRGVLTTGDRDMFIASSRLIGAAGTRTERTLLATAGDRLALEHFGWRGSDDGVVFEMDNLGLIEVDAEGRIVAVIGFDPDDRHAANAELVDRHARSETSRWVPAAFFELRRATVAHDLARCRAALPDDFAYHDHRRTGPGRIDGAAFIAWVASLFEQSPDAIFESMYEVATGPHAVLHVDHVVGTLAEGGAFEQVFVVLAWFRGDRLAGAEVFELEDLDRARARFEALRAES